MQAANILIDTSGHVILADLGVTCQMERNFNMERVASREGTLAYLSRNTFAGTPCWMAPEVMEENVGCAAALPRAAHGGVSRDRAPPRPLSFPDTGRWLQAPEAPSSGLNAARFLPGTSKATWQAAPGLHPARARRPEAARVPWRAATTAPPTSGPSA